MTSSLVGSEMCIRDREGKEGRRGETKLTEKSGQLLMVGFVPPGMPRAVSYTHLTLPTICSV
eukprot:9305761-Prorocentrum_lima.AAC.1